MKKLFPLVLVTGLAIAFLIPITAIAQSVFDGVWKVDMNKAQMPKKPTYIR